MRTLPLLAVLLLATPAAVGQASLFAPTDAARTATPSPHHARFVADAAVLDAEVVSADVAALTAEAVSLDLLGETYVYTRTDLRSRTADDWTWTGRRGTDTAVLVARKGRVTGVVWADGATFEIRPAGGRLHTVARLVPGARPADGPDYVLPEDSAAPPPPSTSDAGTAARASAGTTLDMVAGFTPDLTDIALDPVAAIQLSIDVTNASFQNSGIDAELVLRHAFPVPSANIVNVGQNLDALLDPADGAFDEVHTVRDAYGADLAAIYVSHSSVGSACGVAPVNGDDRYGFTAIAADCTNGVTLAHEIGHIVGALHDPYVNTGTLPYAYGQGFVDTAGRWRTVMSYNNECADAGFSCESVPYWSSPAVQYDDTTAPEHDGPTGDAAARDNVRLWGERLATVGAFRAARSGPSVASVSPAQVTADVAPNGTVTQSLAVSNAAAAGAYPLSWRARAGNLTQDGAPLGTPCTPGQLMTQETVTNVRVLSDGVAERGQSFETACWGRIRSAGPKHQVGASRTGDAWSGTLHLFEGEGVAGAERAAIAASHTNPANPGHYFAPFTLPAPLDVDEGDRFTWFLDMTTGEIEALYSNADAYAGGVTYAGTSTAAAADASEDQAFQVVYDAPSLWYTVSDEYGSTAPGAASTLDLAFDATGLAEGAYVFDLTLTTNDPSAPAVTVPVTLNVRSSVDRAAGPEALGVRLDAPEPNPSHGPSAIAFHLASPGPARLSVVDLTGREVAVLAEGSRPAGTSRVALPSGLAPGVYVVRLVAEGTAQARRWVVVR